MFSAIGGGQRTLFAKVSTPNDAPTRLRGAFTLVYPVMQHVGRHGMLRNGRIGHPSPERYHQGQEQGQQGQQGQRSSGPGNLASVRDPGHFSNPVTNSALRPV